MTTLTRKLVRRAVKPLDKSFGCDKHNQLAVALIPGTDQVPDMLEMWPVRTRRREKIALIDVYRFAIRSRVNLELLVKARAVKDRKATRLAAARQQRAERRLFGKEAA